MKLYIEPRAFADYQSGLEATRISLAVVNEYNDEIGLLTIARNEVRPNIDFSSVRADHDSVAIRDMLNKALRIACYEHVERFALGNQAYYDWSSIIGDRFAFGEVSSIKRNTVEPDLSRLTEDQLIAFRETGCYFEIAEYFCQQIHYSIGNFDDLFFVEIRHYEQDVYSTFDLVSSHYDTFEVLCFDCDGDAAHDYCAAQVKANARKD